MSFRFARGLGFVVFAFAGGWCSAMGCGSRTGLDLLNERSGSAGGSSGTGADGTVQTVDPCGSQTGSIVLAGEQVGVNYIAVGSTAVYWTNTDLTPLEGSPGANLVTVPLCGGKATTLTSTSGFGGIALDPENVYWTATSDGTVVKMPLGGGTPTTLASGLGQPASLVVDSTTVFWTDSGDGTVMAVPLGGGTPTTLASGQHGPQSIAVDATSVYWVNGADPGVYPGSVMKVPIAGGAPTTLAAQQDAPYGIAVDSRSVYFTTATAVMKVPLGGGTLVTLASGQGSPAGIAIDSTNVYWTTAGGDTVMSILLAGGTPTTLGSGLIGPLGIAVDDFSLYWTNQGVPWNPQCGDVVGYEDVDGGAPPFYMGIPIVIGEDGGPTTGGPFACEAVMKLTPK